MKTHVFAALSVATVRVPASTDGRHPAERQLVAIGLFAGACANKRWRFLNHAAAIGAGDPVGPLLQWLTDTLPVPATMIGWQLDSHVMPILMDAAANVPAETANASMTRLASALRAGTIDLALHHGGATAPPMAEVAAERCVGTSIMTDDERSSHWASHETDHLRADAADQALGMWRLFLKMADQAGIKAEAATEEWLCRRRRLRVVSGSGRERKRKR